MKSNYIMKVPINQTTLITLTMRWLGNGAATFLKIDTLGQGGQMISSAANSDPDHGLAPDAANCIRSSVLANGLAFLAMFSLADLPGNINFKCFLTSGTT